jgi:hypothetical protein
MNGVKSKKQAQNGLPVVRCECGAEILMVPDVKLMGEAIETHVELHMRKLKNPVRADVEAERIRDFLIGQVLDKGGDAGQ